MNFSFNTTHYIYLHIFKFPFDISNGQQIALKSQFDIFSKIKLIIFTNIYFN